MTIATKTGTEEKDLAASNGAIKPTKRKTSKKPARKKATAKKPATKKGAATPGMTLEDLAAKWLAQLEKDGKSESTVFSYRQDLRTAIKALGADTKLSALTPQKVGSYFNSDTVTKKRNGKPRTQRTIDKTRRVLRMALEWAETKGFVEKAPIPAKE